jgi:hypothetical protein
MIGRRAHPIASAAPTAIIVAIRFIVIAVVVTAGITHRTVVTHLADAAA